VPLFRGVPGVELSQSSVVPDPAFGINSRSRGLCAMSPDMEASSAWTVIGHQSARVEIQIDLLAPQEALGVAPGAEGQLLATPVAVAQQAAAEPNSGNGTMFWSFSPPERDSRLWPSFGPITGVDLRRSRYPPALGVNAQHQRARQVE
jgi:hypothetical protein